MSWQRALTLPLALTFRPQPLVYQHQTTLAERPTPRFLPSTPHSTAATPTATTPSTFVSAPPLPSFVIPPSTLRIGLQFARSPPSSPATRCHQDVAPRTPARLSRPLRGGRGARTAMSARLFRVQVLQGDRLSLLRPPMARAVTRARSPQRAARRRLQLAPASSQKADYSPCLRRAPSHTQATPVPGALSRLAFVIGSTLALGFSR